MKKILTMMLVAVTVFGCSYDDDDLWNKVNDLDSRLEEVEKQIEDMNSDISTMQTIVNVLKNGGVITDVHETADGWEVTLSDGSSFVVKHGTNGINGTAGADAPVIGVKKYSEGPEADNEYYWTITVGSEEKWLPNNDTPQLRVTGHSPVLDVDSEGYWTVDGERIEVDGEEIKAKGEKGDSFFQEVITDGEKVVVFVLQNGTRFTIPRGNSFLYFSGSKKSAVFNYGSSQTLALTANNIEFMEILSKPDGWSASLDFENGELTITAPASGDGGIVSLIGLDNNGNTLMAACNLAIVPDYTDFEGTFLLNEGNMGTQDGTIIWYDGSLAEYRDIYQKANDGRSPGNVLQDMFIADGKVYLVCQNGSSRGGDGQLLICDAGTMTLEKAYDDLDFQRKTGYEGCPQHIVVAENKVFIQYVDYAYESNSGIRVFDLATETLKDDDIAGTYGPFGYGSTEMTTGGALKAKMLYSRGQIIAGLAKAVVFIDPATETITKTIPFTGGVKDIVKGADGNLYIAVTADYETPQGYYDPNPDGSRIYKYDQGGNQLGMFDLTGSGIAFSTSTANPTIGMSANFTEPYLYFNPDTDMMASDFTSRFDYTSGTLDVKYVQPQAYSYVWGYTGTHPTKDYLFVGGNPNWAWTRLTVYDISSPASPSLLLDTNRDYRNYTASPAGIYFSYSFSAEYQAK